MGGESGAGAAGWRGLGVGALDLHMGKTAQSEGGYFWGRVDFLDRRRQDVTRRAPEAFRDVPDLSGAEMKPSDRAPGRIDRALKGFDPARKDPEAAPERSGAR